MVCASRRSHRTASSKASKILRIRSTSACSGIRKTCRASRRRHRSSAHSSTRRADTRRRGEGRRRNCHQSARRDRNSLRVAAVHDRQGGIALKRTVLLAAAAMLLTQQVFAGAWLKSLTVAQKKAKEQNQLIFVDLFADWCGWCHKMEQEVFPSETFQKATDNKVLLRLNTEDAGEGSKLAQRFSITTLPTFLLLTPEGTIAGVIRGYFPANDFVRAVADSENKYKGFLKTVAAEASLADYSKRLDLAKEFRA